MIQFLIESKIIHSVDLFFCHGSVDLRRLIGHQLFFSTIGRPLESLRIEGRRVKRKKLNKKTYVCTKGPDFPPASKPTLCFVALCLKASFSLKGLVFQAE